jgi:hypothetical protein
MTLGKSLLAGSAAALAFAGAAHAGAPRERPVRLHETTVGGGADGRRTVVTYLGPAMVRVTDDGDGLGGGRDVAIPDGCDWWGAVGGGQLAFDCHDDGPDGASSKPVLYDIAARSYHRPVREELLAHRETANSEWYASTAVGSRLVGVSVTGNHVDFVDYFDWTAGGWLQPWPGDREVVSLDVPAGKVAVCAPVRFPATTSFRAAAGQRVVWRHLHHLELQRCGSTRPVVLSRHARGDPFLTGRMVAWTTERSLHIFRFATGERLRWTLPKEIACGRCVGGPDLYGTWRHLFVGGQRTWVLDLGA